MNVTIDLTAPDLRSLMDKVTGPAARARLHAAMGAEVQVETAAHLRGLAGSRHATANRLGASPTNFLAQAADKVESPAALESSADAATLTLDHPGMIRAFRDVRITPDGHPYLSIPANALAYGKSPRECAEVQFVRGGAPVRTDIAAFLLVRSVTQPQDRSLLPSDAEWQDAAARGAVNFFNAEIPS